MRIQNRLIFCERGIYDENNYFNINYMNCKFLNLGLTGPAMV